MSEYIEKLVAMDKTIGNILYDLQFTKFKSVEDYSKYFQKEIEKKGFVIVTTERLEQ